jgi:hypothetical protein
VGYFHFETGRESDPKHISTSFVERQNWSVRTSMRRYTRFSPCIITFRNERKPPSQAHHRH